MVVTDREPVIPPPALLKRVSWGAIFAGAVIAVAITALLGLLGLGLGLDSFEIGETSVEAVPKATLIWWAATSIIATGLGAFVAARLAGIPHSITGALHGMAVWAVASLLTLWLAASAVGFAFGVARDAVETTARVTTGAVRTVGGAAISVGGEAIPSPTQEQVAVARDRVRQEAVSIARDAGIGQQSVEQAQNALAATARDIIRTPDDLGQDLNQLIDRLFRGPDAALSPAERERLVTVIAERTGVSREEAERIADRWQVQATAAWENVRTTGATTANQVEATAVDVGTKTIDVMADAAWGMFWISLAGLVAALLGAAIGGATVVVPATARVHEVHEEVE